MKSPIQTPFSNHRKALAAKKSAGLARFGGRLFDEEAAPLKDTPSHKEPPSGKACEYFVAVKTLKGGDGTIIALDFCGGRIPRKAAKLCKPCSDAVNAQMRLSNDRVAAAAASWRIK